MDHEGQILNRLRAAVFIASTVLLLALSAGPALAVDHVSNGDTSVTLTTDTPAVTVDTRIITATVTIVTGRKPARFGLDAKSARFTRFVAGRPFHEGMTLRMIGLGDVTGPLEFISEGSGSSSGGCAADDGSTMKGIGEADSLQEFQIRAGSTVTMTYRYEVVGDAPWINADYSPRVQVKPLYSYRGSGHKRNPKKWSEFSKSTTLSAPKPTFSLALAARIDLAITPRPKIDAWGFATVQPGKKLTIRGMIVPARAGLPINIWRNVSHLVATRVTDSNGEFTYEFTPKAGDAPYVRTEFPGAPGADLAPDYGCDISFYAPTVRNSK
jgi:hypothetical protein